tara:strand:+ start:201 stop:644 length:444 start_codon:yes stop_codon:yes gene_type:complete
MEASLKQAVQQVWDELKCYHTEHVYKCALQIALQELGITADAEVVHPIKFRDRVVGFQRFVRASPFVVVGPLSFFGAPLTRGFVYWQDLLCQDAVIEIKAVKRITDREIGQADRYQRTTGKPVALVNFGSCEARILWFRSPAADKRT